jgi:DNA polymerase I-like protein with 3'-5' exonuclease and polymerase domains
VLQVIISLDTETTGVDFAHGAMPFLVSTCDDGGRVRFWEWDVDPLTRRPLVPDADLAEIAEAIDAADLVYAHNAKFDWRALAAVGVDLPWEKVRDTLVAAHLLASNHPHDLTWSCVEYLRADIGPREQRVKDIVKVCRQIAKRNRPNWLLADEGTPGMPSVKPSSKRDEDKPWKNDMWLPRALSAQAVDIGLTNGWVTACAEYAVADAEHTLPLGLEMERRVRERGLWRIYEHRLHLPRAACEMECWGLTGRADYTDATIADYEEHVAEGEAALVGIAAARGHDLALAEGASINDNMRDFFYGSVAESCARCGHSRRVKHWASEVPEGGPCPKCARGVRGRVGMSHPMTTSRRPNLALPVVFGQKTGNASLDKDAMAEYLRTAEGEALDFVRVLLDKRKHETDLAYMRSYRKFGVPVPGAPGYYRIHPSLNPFGTDHLRWASNSPNLQNVGVQEERCEDCDGAGCVACGGTGKTRLSVRACFGPAPGREWWDMDFKNLEKRIPVYECGERSLIEVFERPDDPPYWGSDHCVLASLIFPEEYWPLAEVRDGFKQRYLIKYKRVKNTNFAKQYGAGRRKVDATAGVVGAFDRIERGLPEMTKLQAHYLAVAERTGVVETLPDRTVDPERGYPVIAARTEGGRVLSTTPFNYHVSGTACWVKNAALLRCAAKCAEWRRDGFDARVALEVHDSLLFDFPRGATPEENLPRAMVLKALMERCGEDLIPPIPTPVSVERVAESWAAGVRVK